MGTRALVLAAALWTSACGAEAVLGPLIVLSNTWRDAANAAHTFSFIDDTNQTPSRSGAFTGNETTPGPNSVQFPFTGFWRENGRIEFTVQRPTPVTYTGQLTSNLNRMELSSTAGHLVLVRN
jgi:hypothetical protein